MKKINFITWYDETTPRVVESIESILLYSAPWEVNIIAVKCTPNLLEIDSKVRWLPRTQVLYNPQRKKKIAWEMGLKLEKTSVNYIALCDPYFIAKPKLLEALSEICYYRFFLPYENEPTEEKISFSLVKENIGSKMIITPKEALYGVTFPNFFDSFCLDNFIFDKLASYGYVGYQLPKSKIEVFKPELTERQKEIKESDEAHYKIWLKDKYSYENIVKRKYCTDFCE